MENTFLKLSLAGSVSRVRPLFLDDDESYLSTFGWVLRQSYHSFCAHCYYRASIRKFNSKTGEMVGTFNGHNCEVTACVRFGVKDKLVLSSSSDGSLLLWNYVRLSLLLLIDFNSCRFVAGIAQCAVRI